jgi:hypothetical protein
MDKLFKYPPIKNKKYQIMLTFGRLETLPKITNKANLILYMIISYLIIQIINQTINIHHLIIYLILPCKAQSQPLPNF